MKKTLLLLAFIFAILSITSCGPVVESIYLDSMNLNGENVILQNRNTAVVGVFSSKKDSAIVAQMALGLSEGLETDFILPENSIEVFMNHPKDINVNNVNSLYKYSTISSNDVLFVMDSLKLGHFSMRKNYYFDMVVNNNNLYQYNVIMPVEVRVTEYDADNMTKIQHKVLIDTLSWVLASANKLSETVAFKKANDQLYPSLNYFGLTIAKQYSPAWTTKSYDFIVYLSDDKWNKAYSYAQNLNWGEARKIWMSLANTDNDIASSTASYNVAITLYIEGYYDLAEKWLNYSIDIFQFDEQNDLKLLIDDKIQSENSK
ncbi:MAG: DUF6340 family protein [Bacteroidales bacterium]